MLYLVIMEDDIGVLVLSGHSVGPQLLHEEHLVCELRVVTWTRGNKKNSIKVLCWAFISLPALNFTCKYVSHIFHR